MKLEVGKTYKSRGGRKVLITRHDPVLDCHYPFFDANNDCYTANGMFNAVAETHQDLIEEEESMTESKFKLGDTVFHVGLGIGTIADVDNAWPEPVITVCFGSPDFTGYGAPRLHFSGDGKGDSHHLVPQLYTLEEARKMGFDVPKEKVKKSKTLWVYYNIASRNFMTCVEREPDQVGYLEKEVTFEWDEEI